MEERRRALLSGRRTRFMERLGGGVALLFAPPEAAFGHDVSYRYRPDPDFHFLTGFPEPDAVAVLDADRRRFLLFVRPRDRAKETWDGRRAGPEGAISEYGADEAYALSELEARLPDLVRAASVLHHAFGASEEGDRRVVDFLARFRREARNPLRGPTSVADPTAILHELRLVKDSEELALLARSASIAAEAHREAMALAAPGRREYELEAAVDRRFRASGAAGPAYPTIVAGGANATILHYVENSAPLADGDLVLVDAGCEYEGYASDVTRTYPVSGRFTPVQRRVYELVLAAQAAAISAVRPGARIEDVHAAARGVLVDGLFSLGLLSGDRGEAFEKNEDQRFTLHRTSHWLGRDVHDRGRYVEPDGASRLLVPGMVLTVEPGLYFRLDEDGVPAGLRGIGVRIEDDVAVTERGSEVLSAAAPKQPDELESIVGTK
ncbi:MAG TPA: aminopeptidase P N-terminal domain-containing protein [Thermoanaerobaculia bacterium]|nr:aminopeptidase P N-terminal domain-containing protein [Thermoanaerobaculia bacterium]